MCPQPTSPTRITSSAVSRAVVRPATPGRTGSRPETIAHGVDRVLDRGPAHRPRGASVFRARLVEVEHALRGAGRSSCESDTPSSLTPREQSSSPRSSRAVARKTVLTSVAAGRVRARVRVSKVANRNFSVTVRASRPRAPQPRARAVDDPHELAIARRGSCRSTCEGLLGADRLRLALGHDRARIVVARERVQPRAERISERACERRFRQRGQLADRRHGETLEAFERGRTHAPEARDRERREEVALGSGRDDDEAVGLGEVARELGEELGGGDTDRHDEAGFVAHAAPDRRGDLGPGAEQAPRAAHVEEGLVDRELLDQRCDRLEDGHHLATLHRVAAEARRDEHACGHARRARPIGNAECTPKRRAS